MESAKLFAIKNVTSVTNSPNPQYLLGFAVVTFFVQSVTCLSLICHPSVTSHLIAWRNFFYKNLQNSLMTKRSEMTRNFC